MIRPSFDVKMSNSPNKNAGPPAVSAADKQLSNHTDDASDFNDRWDRVNPDDPFPGGADPTDPEGGASNPASRRTWSMGICGEGMVGQTKI
jgi:hypothetical protein